MKKIFIKLRRKTKKGRAYFTPRVIFAPRDKIMAMSRLNYKETINHLFRKTIMNKTLVCVYCLFYRKEKNMKPHETIADL